MSTLPLSRDLQSSYLTKPVTSRSLGELVVGVGSLVDISLGRRKRGTRAARGDGQDRDEDGVETHGD